VTGTIIDEIQAPCAKLENRESRLGVDLSVHAIRSTSLLILRHVE